MSITNLSLDSLKEIISIKEQIASLESKLAAILGGNAPAKAGKKRGPKKMSAAGLAKIAAAQKARWAKVKAGKTPAKAEKPAKKKRTLSPAHKAKLLAAVKARWAEAKGTVVKADKAVVTSVKKAKHQLSPEGRARLFLL